MSDPIPPVAPDPAPPPSVRRMPNAAAWMGLIVLAAAGLGMLGNLLVDP